MLVLITDRSGFGKKVVEKLFEKNVYCFSVPFENALFLCREKDTGGVILDATLSLPAAEETCRALRESYPDIPIAALLTSDQCPDMPVDTLIRSSDFDADFARMFDFSVEVCGFYTKPIGTYDLYIGLTWGEVHYKRKPLKLSETEYRILRFLLYRAPRLTSADDLLSLCFFGDSQRLSNLEAVISHINKKAFRINKSKLIINEYKKGYRLRDGIL